jgi:hypothetical protein
VCVVLFQTPMPRIQRLFVAFILVLTLSSCKSESHVEASFYYWKTQYSLTGTDSAALKNLGVHRLYVRFFDITADWGNKPYPVGRLENAEPFPADIEVVPVIFIANTVFSYRSEYEAQRDETLPIPDYHMPEIDSATVRALAEDLVRKTLRMAKRYTTREIREIQLDCDWTPSSRDLYFYLISEVKRLAQGLTISATIRLHQFKYVEKTGVPPADRGMLMYYNMSRLQDTATRNYILDNDEGEKYLVGAKTYSLPLDFALPIHTQATVFTKYAYETPAPYRFHGLLTTVQFSLIQSLGDHLLPIDHSKYLLKKDYNFSTDARYFWLNEGSLIRYDEVSTEALLRAAKHIAPLANTENYRVVFFHLDSLNLNKHSSETLARIIDQFN